MFFRLQRLSVYFAKLLESKAHPLWGFDDPIDPRAFAREVRKHALRQGQVQCFGKTSMTESCRAVLAALGCVTILSACFPQRSSFSGAGGALRRTIRRESLDDPNLFIGEMRIRSSCHKAMRDHVERLWSRGAHAFAEERVTKRGRRWLRPGGVKKGVPPEPSLYSAVGVAVVGFNNRRVLR